ncbi:hypothetical protein VTK26DRAFT_1002 [Humicola hyalothermophila]
MSSYPTIGDHDLKSALVAPNTGPPGEMRLPRYLVLRTQEAVSPSPLWKDLTEQVLAAVPGLQSSGYSPVEVCALRELFLVAFSLSQALLFDCNVATIGWYRTTGEGGKSSGRSHLAIYSDPLSAQHLLG